MDNNALFVLYHIVTLCRDKYPDVVYEKRLSFPKTVITSTVTRFFTIKLTLALCHIPRTYPKMALANNKT